MATSSAETGSSQTTSSGLVASARAMLMRWRCPPENWCGNRRCCSGPQADRGEQIVDARGALARAAPDCMRSSGARTASPARWRGLSEENGSWKMICTRFRRQAQRFAFERAEIGVAEADRTRR